MTRGQLSGSGSGDSQGRAPYAEAYSQHLLKVWCLAQMLASASPVNKSQGYDCGIYPTNACAGIWAGSVVGLGGVL